MSSVENANKTIEKMIENLAEEYGQTGLFTTPSDKRKKKIIKEIAKLRASMNQEDDSDKK